MPGCIGVDFWGFTDKHTWVRDFLFLDDDPLLFDAEHLPKAAFFGGRGSRGRRVYATARGEAPGRVRA